MTKGNVPMDGHRNLQLPLTDDLSLDFPLFTLWIFVSLLLPIYIYVLFCLLL
jgi:hypothetical protein